MLLLLFLPVLPKGRVEPRPWLSPAPSWPRSPPGLSDPGPYAHSPWSPGVLLLPPRLPSSSSCSLKPCFYFSPRPLVGGAPCALWQQEEPRKSPLEPRPPHQLLHLPPSLTSSRCLSWRGVCSSPRRSQPCPPTSSPTPRPCASTCLSSASWPPVAVSLSSSHGQVSTLGRWGHSGLGLGPFSGPFTQWPWSSPCCSEAQPLHP